MVKEGNNTVIIQLSLDEVCRERNEETIRIVSIKQNYSNSKQRCNQMGGNLHYPKNNIDIENLPLKLLKNNHLKEENITELINICGSTFWIPIKQNGTKSTITGGYAWHEDIENGTKEAHYLPWLFGQPNGGK